VPLRLPLQVMMDQQFNCKDGRSPQATFFGAKPLCGGRAPVARGRGHVHNVRTDTPRNGCLFGSEKWKENSGEGAHAPSLVTIYFSVMQSVGSIFNCPEPFVGGCTPVCE
jgi:hypothetical protein